MCREATSSVSLRLPPSPQGEGLIHSKSSIRATLYNCINSHLSLKSFMKRTCNYVCLFLKISEKSSIIQAHGVLSERKCAGMGFDMSIAAMSVGMHQAQAQQQLDVSVLKMAMDTAEMGVEEMLEELPVSLDPSLGSMIDITA